MAAAFKYIQWMTGGNWIAGVDDFTGELHGMRDFSSKPQYLETRVQVRKNEKEKGGREGKSEGKLGRRGRVRAEGEQ